ncbi:KAT8 regulatory NSL complex subunit 1-like isoform X1 [Carcharodon carcharias]|uniref:KAT8 regulatory NSL complex subunit 1-like isoform X1 n=1 Tax=Carcharodon carcharias TaxID=13397 RepID=UPI001B7DA713|nr:KAT8 regulatory NSL complex subunit 1-like isoform X1 [Carcharodon carcharias]
MAAGRLKRMVSPAVSESAGEARQQQHGLNLAVSSSPLPPLSSLPPSAASSPPSSSAPNSTLDEGEENNKNNKLAGPLYFSVDRMDSLFLARPTRVRRRPEPFFRGERCAAAARGGAKDSETNNYNHHNHCNNHHHHHSPHRRHHRHHQAGEPAVSSTAAPGLGLNRGSSRFCAKRQDGMNSDGFFPSAAVEEERGNTAVSSTAGNCLAKEPPCLTRDSGLMNGSNKAAGGCGVQRNNGAISLNSASPGKGNLDKSRWLRLQQNTNTTTSDLGLLSKGSRKIPGLEYGCRAEFHGTNPGESSLKSRCSEVNVNCTGTETQNKKHTARRNSTISNTIKHHNNCNSLSNNVNSTHNNINVSQDEVSAQSILVMSKQAEIRSRAHRLCKRLQVVQAKQVERHAQQQLAGLVGHSLKRFSSSFTESFINNNSSSSSNKHKSTLYGNSALLVGSSLLRSFPRTDSEGGGGGAHSSPSSSLRSGGGSKCLLSSPNGDTFSGFLKDRAVSEDLLKLVSSVTAKLRTSERAFDSDATESSSGGETDVEEDGTGGAKFAHRHAVLHRRSEWRWAMERAAIVNRWTWLQAQVSDLEYRIRQQTDIYRQIRANKGPVVLGETQLPEDLMKNQYRLATTTSAIGSQGPEAYSNASSAEVPVPIANNKCELSPCSPSLLLRNIDKQSSRLTQSLGSLICPSSPSCSSPSSSSLLPKVCTPPRQLNGLLNSLHSSPLDNSSLDSSDTEEILCKRQRLDGLTIPSSPPDNSCVAARIRPVRRYRKRRLVRSNLACYLGRKAQRPLSVKCSCDWPNVCILCGSKTLMQAMDQPSMSPEECVAIMEPCYHPILSLPQDTPLHVHFEALLKQEEHQKPSQKLKSLKSFSQVRQRPQDTAKKVCQKLVSSLLTSAKYVQSRNASEKVFKQRLDHWQPISKTEIDPFTEKLNTQIKKQRSSFNLGLNKRHKAASSSSPSLLNPQTPKPSSVMHQSPSYTDIPPSVVHNQPASSTTSTPSARRRRGESSFDINNIVIPMSMAAAARVEKLQYKEILTPSWRVADVEQSKLQNCKLEDDQYEDMSDEAFLNRHSKCEEMERARWCLWSSSSSARRGSRSSNKADGRSTPQPQQVNSTTPQPVSPDSGFHLLNDYPHTPSFTGPVSPETYSSLNSFSKDRIRVLSFSEDTRSSTPEVTDEEVQMVQPWEPRIFPLSAEDMELLKGHTNPHRESRCERPRDLHWLSANKPGIRTESAECIPSLTQSPRGLACLQDDNSSDLRLTLAIENERSMDR